MTGSSAWDEDEDPFDAEEDEDIDDVDEVADFEISISFDTDTLKLRQSSIITQL